MQWGIWGGPTVMGPEDTMRGPARRVLRKLRPREVKCPSRGHPAHGQSWDLHTGQLLQGPHPPTHHVGSSQTKLGTQNGRGGTQSPGECEGCWDSQQGGGGKEAGLSCHFADYPSCHPGGCTASLLVCKDVSLSQRSQRSL